MQTRSFDSLRILFPEGATTVGSEVFESPIWDTWIICNLGSIETNTGIQKRKIFEWEDWLLTRFKAVRYGHKNHYTLKAIHLFKVIAITSEKSSYDYLPRCSVDSEQMSSCWKSATNFFIALIKQVLIIYSFLYSFCKIYNITKSRSFRKTCIEFHLSFRRSI